MTKRLNFCIDCKQNISSKRSDAKRCDNCYKKYRNKIYFPAYRKLEVRKETVKKDNNSERARERKRLYNNTIKGKLSHLKYRKSEKGKVSSKVQVLKRRVRLKGISRSYNLSSRNITLLKEMFSSCFYCGSKNELQIEHIVPVSKGGGNNIENLLFACKKCNKQKGNIDFRTFLEKYPEKKKYYYKHHLAMDHN